MKSRGDEWLLAHCHKNIMHMGSKLKEEKTDVMACTLYNKKNKAFKTR